MNKKTLVLGASDNPARYSYMAIQRLIAAGYDVVAIGKRAGEVAGIPILQNPIPISDVHTITIYLNAVHQKEYYSYIHSLHPKRIIFNPGAENDELAALAKQHNIQTIEACTLVMLASARY